MDKILMEAYTACVKKINIYDVLCKHGIRDPETTAEYLYSLYTSKDKDKGQNIADIVSVPVSVEIVLALRKQAFKNAKREVRKNVLRISDIPHGWAAHFGGALPAVEVEEIELKYSEDEIETKLPVEIVGKKLLSCIENNDICIVKAETGSGKTTIIPRLLYEAGYAEKGVITCVQTRRIACQKLADQVSQMLAPNKEHVGYNIRFDNHTTSKTKIEFVTDGIFIKKCLDKKAFSRSSVIILDEIHERRINGDVIMGMLKQRILQNKKIPKIIITSATIVFSEYKNYFPDSACIKIVGRQYPIEIIYNSSNVKNSCCMLQNDILSSAYKRILEIHNKEKDGDVLVFLSGMREIHRMSQIITKSSTKNQLEVYKLHGKLDMKSQSMAFRKTKKGFRKIILATNIAEVTVTIPNIKYVVDTGMRKYSSYDPIHCVAAIKEGFVTRYQSDQRAGRSGRTGPGVCYRIYTEKEYNSFKQIEEPSILTENLTSFCLELLFAGIKNIYDFPLMCYPEQARVNNGLLTLALLGAINNNKTITPFGSLMVKLPVSPEHARVLIEAALYGNKQYLEDVTMMVAILENEDFCTEKTYESEDFKEFCVKNSQNAGDLFVYLKLIRHVEKKDSTKQLMHLQTTNLYKIHKTYSHVMLTMNNMKFVHKKTSTDYFNDIFWCFYQGFFTNIFRGSMNTTRNRATRTTITGENICHFLRMQKSVQSKQQTCISIEKNTPFLTLIKHKKKNPQTKKILLMYCSIIRIGNSMSYIRNVFPVPKHFSPPRDFVLYN